jgi:hypothetical protein
MYNEYHRERERRGRGNVFTYIEKESFKEISRGKDRE